MSGWAICEREGSGGGSWPASDLRSSSRGTNIGRRRCVHRMRWRIGWSLDLHLTSASPRDRCLLRSSFLCVVPCAAGLLLAAAQGLV